MAKSLKSIGIRAISVIITILLIISMLPAVYASTYDESTQKQVSYIMMSSSPYKTNYKIGEEIDPTGGSIWVNYDDGSYEIIDITREMISYYDPYMSGPHWVDIEYMGQYTYFEINVTRTPERIEAYNNSPRYYYDGDIIDLWEISLNIYYDDGSYDCINANDPNVWISDTIAHADSGYWGGSMPTCSQQIMVEYRYFDPETGYENTLSTSFQIEVEPIRIMWANIDNSSLTIYQGDRLDPNQFNVSIMYNNGQSIYCTLNDLMMYNIYYSVNDSGPEFSGAYTDLYSFDSFKTGMHRLDIMFSDMNMGSAYAYIDVGVIPVNAYYCRVMNPPYKTSYFEGESLELYGLCLEVDFSDGMTKRFELGDIFNYYYPNYYDYYMFDKTELYNLSWEVSICDINGYEIPAGCFNDISQFSQLPPGEYQIRFTGYNANNYLYPYEYRATTYLNVEIKAIDAVTCNTTQLPYTTTFIQGEELDLSGCSIQVDFSDGYTEIYDAANLDYYNHSYSDSYPYKTNWLTSIYAKDTDDYYSVDDFKNLKPGIYEVRFMCSTKHQNDATLYASTDIEIKPVIGDANIDGEINIDDATQIQNILAENCTVDEAVLAYADFDGDGCVSIRDVTAIQKHLAGITI